MAAVVLFHCCSCNLLRNSLLMFSRITLLILPISFFAGLMSLAATLFSKFGLWSFNVIKHSSLPLTWILSRMFFLFAIIYSYLLFFFFPAFGLNMKTCRVSSHIHSECGIIRARLTPNTNTFHAVDVRTLLRYFNTIVL